MRFIIALMFACISFVPTSASAQGVFPGGGVLLHAACEQWLEENPDFNPISENLPAVCLFHYAGWDCEQPWTPAGWLRPGGYCEQAKSVKSLVPSGKGEAHPRYECPVLHETIVMMVPPGYECEYPTYPNNNPD
jgi:hypothetical protein